MIDPIAEVHEKKILVLTDAIVQLGTFLSQTLPHTSGSVSAVMSNISNNNRDIENELTRKMVEGSGPVAYQRWLLNNSVPITAPADIPLQIYTDKENNPAYRHISNLKMYFNNTFPFLNMPINISELPHFNPDYGDVGRYETGLYQAPRENYGSTERLCALIKTKDTNQCVIVRELKSTASCVERSIDHDYVYVPIEKQWVRYSANAFVCEDSVKAEIAKIKKKHDIPVANNPMSANELALLLSMEIGNMRAIFKDSFESRFEISKPFDNEPKENGIYLRKYTSKITTQTTHVLYWRFGNYILHCKVSTPESNGCRLTAIDVTYGIRYNKPFDEFDAYTREGLVDKIFADLREKYSEFVVEEEPKSL